MNNVKAAGNDIVQATVIRPTAGYDKVRAGGVFHVLCYDKDGNLKWKEENHNLVTNAGLLDMNFRYFGAVQTNPAYTAAWFIGLYGTGASVNPLAGDTMATASFTSTGSSIASTTLTIGTLATGTIVIGQMITGTGVFPGTYITANISGSGSGSTWTVSRSQTVTSTAINSTTARTWSENTTYSQSTRPAAAFGVPTYADPSQISNSSTVNPSGSPAVAVFSINGTTTIGGAFLTSDSTKSGVTGVLFSASDFTGGDRAVISGDTLNVTYTFNLDAA